MTWKALTIILVLTAGCAGPSPDATTEPDQPIYDGPTPEEIAASKAAQRSEALYYELRNQSRDDPWGDATQTIVAQGSVDWHNDPAPFSMVYDRVVQIALPECTFNGSPYFHNVQLAAVNLWNFTERVEVVMEWDLTSYTRDALRLSYRPGQEGDFTDSPPAKSGEAIPLPVDFMGWDESPDGSQWGGDWPFYACMDRDVLDPSVPGYFEGELRYTITAFKMDEIPYVLQYGDPE